MTELIPQTSCVTAEGLDQTCVCTNRELNEQITMCASQRCLVKELLSTKNASMTACGAPTRDRSSEITILGLSFGAAAYATFVVRVLARILAYQKRLFMDDWTMLGMVVRSLPYNAVDLADGDRLYLFHLLFSLHFLHITVLVETCGRYHFRTSAMCSNSS